MQFLVYDPNQNPEAALPEPGAHGRDGEVYRGGDARPVWWSRPGRSKPKGTRLRLSGGKFTVTDGPFIEVKELMGGFAVIQVKSLEEAIEWSKRFRKIVGDGESEIVQVFGPDDFGPA